MRVGLEVKDSEVLLVPPHSSPLLRGGVRWLVTRQFQVVVFFAMQVCMCAKLSKSTLVFKSLLEATFPLTESKFSLISSFFKQTSRVT